MLIASVSWNTARWSSWVAMRNSWPRADVTAPCSICRRSVSPPPRMKRERPMMSSLDRKAAVRDELPPALSSMWRLCKLGYRHEPRLLLVAFLTALLSALPDALLALWFKLLGQGV